MQAKIALIGFTLVLFSILTSCSSEQNCICNGMDCLTGSGDLVNLEYDLDSFETIIHRGNLDIVYYSSEEYQVELITHDNLQQAFMITARENFLSVWNDDACVSGDGFSRLMVGSPILNRIDSDGSGDITIESLNSTDNDFFIRKQGSGDVEISEDAVLNSLFIGSVGSGDVKAFNTLTDSCYVVLIGSGDVEVAVNNTLVVERNGSGSVFYKGTPDIEILEDEGSGEIIDAN